MKTEDKPLAEFHQLLDSLAPASHFHMVMNHLSDIRVLVKDRKRRFLWVSDNVPARHGFATAAEMVGLTDIDINPKSLATSYSKDDVYVLTTGKPIFNKLEISFDEFGLPNWFRVNKAPLRDRKQRVIGLVATIQPLAKEKVLPDAGGDLRKVTNWIMSHLSDQLRVDQLASLIHITARQLERRLKWATGLTPMQFINRCRVMESCRLLRDSDQSIGKIAISVGFYDQSAYTKVFRTQLGLTPLQYRKSRPASH